MREIPLAAIRARAYDIWERNHRPDGFEIQFWLLAERELRAEQDGRRDGAADPSGHPAESPAAPDAKTAAELIGR
ncbi:DUF2934 domain-containing protein [Methylobacterium terricola]|uniref:DUF2934 domain-containing protein n=1 Tax=Methylobacterium terricola TaxID=2583531 RepID=A0A5C4LHV8_9HYPH|nr:DUF2934 domain-containing protein [Methylobacterium terricola]TNC13697.1 DUF2934 domain-containing protein [Methylobacterium terricola]